MSKLEKRKRRARFETSAQVFWKRPRPVIIELLPSMMVLTLKGTRTAYAIPYDVAYDYAMKKALLAAATARRIARGLGLKHGGRGRVPLSPASTHPPDVSK